VAWARWCASPPQVVEAALVGVPHNINGSDFYTFVTVTQDVEAEAKPSFSTAAWTSARGHLVRRS
tara:strand:- start:700 stop:894 length:195 start_codon:yes stop_codon:yes gene_type:complete